MSGDGGAGGDGDRDGDAANGGAVPVVSTSIWVGGYTADMGGEARGIGLLRRDADGAIAFAGVVAPTASPSFLARSGDVIYAAGESGRTVSAFRIAGTTLESLGSQDAAGPYPCSLAVMASGSILLVASYGDGAVGLHELALRELEGTAQATAGAVGPAVQVLRDPAPDPGPHEAQDGSHAHDALQWDTTTVLSTDLGTDRVHVHRLSATGTAGRGLRLTRTGSVLLPAGSGPRDLWLHPSGLVWVLGELGCELFVLARGATGFAVVGRCALPGAEPGDHAAAIAVSTDGRFAYVGLRGSDRVAVLRVREGGALLEPVTSVPCGGNGPRHLVTVGDCLYTANQLSNSVSRLRIGADGVPAFVDAVDVPSPTYLLAAEEPAGSGTASAVAGG